MRHFSIRSKVIFVVLVAGLVCLGTGGMIGYRAGDQALTQAVEQRLSAERDTKRREIEQYIRTQLRLTKEIGGTQDVMYATKAFIAAARVLRAAPPAHPPATQVDTRVLENWYRNNLLPDLDKVTGGSQSVEGLVPADAVGRHLQVEYIADNPYPVGQKYKLSQASAASGYDAVHAEFHPLMQRLARIAGYYDINLIDAQTGDVVYTVAKEADFATNIYNGPYAGSGLARVVQKALDPRNGGAPVVVDYTPYVPSALAPQMFTAVPIVVDGQTLGVFTAQIDIKTLNDMVTDEGRSQEAGQGHSGEVLLVGQDRLLRSQSRFMAQDPSLFLEQAQAEGLPETTADQIETLGTTILYMPANTGASELAFRNKTGLSEFVDYRGVPVIAAYGPLEVGGLRWAVIAKQDVAEAFAPEAALRRDLLTAAGIAAILLTFLALVSASAFTRPLRQVLAGMRRFGASGELMHAPVAGGDDFADLASGYNVMVAALEASKAQLVEAEDEKSSLLRLIYPEAIAERVRNRTEVTAETISNATVIVASIGGLDAMALVLNATETRDRLDTLLNALSHTAEAHGVEPVRSLGEIYIGVCGLSSPRLDHAVRALDWMRAAALAAEQLRLEWDAPISLRFGVASGEIDVLLLSHGHSAFDIWGSTLSMARYIVEGIPAGHVAVSDATFRLLSDIGGFEQRSVTIPPSGDAVAAWVRPILLPEVMGQAA
jgi:class 3 adenylate cyclase